MLNFLANLKKTNFKGNWYSVSFVRISNSNFSCTLVPTYADCNQHSLVLMFQHCSSSIGSCHQIKLMTPRSYYCHRHRCPSPNPKSDMCPPFVCQLTCPTTRRAPQHNSTKHLTCERETLRAKSPPGREPTAFFRREEPTRTDDDDDR